MITLHASLLDISLVRVCLVIITVHYALSTVHLFAQRANKQPFSLCDAGDKPIDGGIKAGKQRTSDVPRGFCGDVEGFCVKLLYDPTHVLLVLLGVKGTRTVDHDAAGIQTFPGVADNLPLQTPTFLDILQTPFADGGRILAEHPFARARYVAENQVELRLRLLKVARVIVGDDAIRCSPFRDILQQNLRPRGDGFVAYQYTVLRQYAAHGRRFSAGSSAEVEDMLIVDSGQWTVMITLHANLIGICLVWACLVIITVHCPLSTN